MNNTPKSPSSGLQIFCQQMTVPGQYGLSFKATTEIMTEHNKFSSANLLLKDSVEGVVWDKNTQGFSIEDSLNDSKPLKDFFVKCASDEADHETRTSFLAAFESGQAINLAAKSASQRNNQNATPYAFQISRMIGRGSLTLEGKTRDCLVYELVYTTKAVGNIETLDRIRPVFGDTDNGAATKFLEFAMQFALAVKSLHNQGVVHSFLVPRNIFCAKHNERWEMTIVGFGYARLCDARGRSASTEPLFKVAEKDNYFRAPECRNNASAHAAFWFPTDIYSIGAILYYILASLDIDNLLNSDEKNASEMLDILKTPPTDTRSLKNLLAFNLRERLKKETEEKTCGENIILENENILKILDSCLRYRAAERFSCIEELIEAIEIATSSYNHNQSTHNEIKKDTENQKNNQSTPDVTENDTENQKNSQSTPDATENDTENQKSRLIKNPYFFNLTQRLSNSNEQSLASLEKGHFEVYGHRDKIVTSLCSILGSNKNTKSYRTMTLPDYWTDANLGSMGRFLTMNKHMARNGVKIERLFLVSQKFHLLSEEHQDILEQQLLAMNDIDNPENFVIKVHIELKEEEITDFESDGKMVAYISDGEIIKNGEFDSRINVVGLNFYSAASQIWSHGTSLVKRQINKVRYWDPAQNHRHTRFVANVNIFNQKWNAATTLDNYINGGIDTMGVSKTSKPLDALKELIGAPR